MGEDVINSDIDNDIHCNFKSYLQYVRSSVRPFTKYELDGIKQLIELQRTKASLSSLI